MSGNNKNVLMIYTDEQRPDSLGCYSGWAKTPVLDRLAREGTCFHECHAPSPVCVPSRTSTFFSRWPQTCGVTDNKYFFEDGILPEGIRSFPQLFAEHGYTTASIGKWHTPHHPTWGETIFWQHFDTVGCYGYLDPDSEADFQVVKRPKGDPIIMAGIYPDDRWGTDPGSYTFDLALDWLKKHAADDNPFFLRIAPLWPHTPVSVPSPWHNHYAPGEIPLQVNDLDMYKNRSAYDKNLADEQGGLLLDRDTWDWIHRCYYGLCSYIDHQVGRVLYFLQEAGLWDDTIIVYTSDHGKHMGEYGACEKGNFDREVWRVPLIIRDPARNRPAQDSRICNANDLGRTLLELCDIVPDQEMIGRNLFLESGNDCTFGVIQKGGVRDVSNPHLRENQGLMRIGVRKESWRFDFTHAVQGKEVPYGQCDAALYHVTDDPAEKRNLASAAEYRRICQELWLLGTNWYREGAWT